MAVGPEPRRITRRSALVIAAAASMTFPLASCTSAGARGPSATSSNERVISLTTVSTLKSAFNRYNGHPRLVLLFSPT